MRYYLIALRSKKTLLDKLMNRTIVEGFDLVDCTLCTRLIYHPDAKHMVYPLWSNKDYNLTKIIIKQMDRFVWDYQHAHNGKCPTMKMTKKELYKILKKQGYPLKESNTYFNIKTELIDK